MINGTQPSPAPAVDNKRTLLAQLLQKQPGQAQTTAPSFAAQRLPILNEKWDAMKARGDYFYHRVIEARKDGKVIVDGKPMLMLASYDYLGFSERSRVRKAAQKAIQKFGPGAQGARMVAGTTKLHKKLEQAIAQFKGAEDAIVFNSGYVTNLATIGALVGKGDVVIGDQFNHASIVDGCRFSGAELKVFPHNDMAALEECLQRSGTAGKLVIVDALFSMDGDLINLPKVVALCQAYGAYLMVDEAHSLGVLGQTGRGIEEHFGLPSDVIDVKMGTLSKTLASVGGYITGKAELIQAVRHNARGLIFSAALPAPQVAAALAALQLLRKKPKPLQQLHRNLDRYLKRLAELGFNTLDSQTPIVPIICQNEAQTFEMTRLCWEKGLFVIPATYPIVSINAPRLRTNITAAHTKQDIDQALAGLAWAGRHVGLI